MKLIYIAVIGHENYLYSILDVCVCSSEKLLKKKKKKNSSSKGKTWAHFDFFAFLSLVKTFVIEFSSFLVLFYINPNIISLFCFIHPNFLLFSFQSLKFALSDKKI